MGSYSLAKSNLLDNEQKTTKTPDNSYMSNPSLAYILEIPGEDERICTAAMAGEKPFYMAYTAMFDQIRICFPISVFQIEVLHNLHLAPSQLHPNGWVFMQAFEVFCWANEWEYSSNVFLYLFGPYRGSTKKPWVSLRHRKNVP
jgi:hypothetical protein